MGIARSGAGSQVSRVAAFRRGLHGRATLVRPVSRTGFRGDLDPRMLSWGEEIPKVAFSNSLTSADWGETEIAAGDLAEAITRLKQERSDGYLLAHGGTWFARSLVETGLIDEYRLVIHPVAGERIFHAPLTIESMSTTAFSGGAVAHVFAAHPPVIDRTPD